MVSFTPEVKFLLTWFFNDPLLYFRSGSDISELVKQKLYCRYEDERVDQFSLGPKEYLKQLVPPTEEVQVTTPGLPAHLMPRSALRRLPLHDCVKAVMINGNLG